MRLLTDYEIRYLLTGLGYPPDDCEDASAWFDENGKDPARRLYHYTIMWHPKREDLTVLARPKEIVSNTDFVITPDNVGEFIQWHL